MSGQVLVAGAAGALGQRVVVELVRRGHRVKVLLHQTPLPGQMPKDLTVVHGTGLDSHVTDKACQGVDVVFSSLGASVSPKPSFGRPTYSRVDQPANLNLIDSAVSARVRRFVYVSVAGHIQLKDQPYVAAHEAVVEALAASAIEHSVVRPTGLFSAFLEILELARRGSVPVIGGGHAKTNPIHEADLAIACADSIEGEGPEILAGGPDVLSRREIVELAFGALGRVPKVRKIPPDLVRVASRALRFFNARLGDITSFYTEVSIQDLVVPSRGTRRLADYFRAAV